jgi:hypothetical protein
MKKILFLVFISVAVTLSVLARAEAGREISVAVSKVSFDVNSGAIGVEGYLPNPCTVGPRPVLTLTENEGVLALKVVARPIAAICIMMVGQPYELEFDVQALKLELLRLRLDTSKTYRIVSMNGTVTFEIDFSEVTDLPAPSNAGFAVQNNGRPQDVKQPVFAY